MSHIEFEKPAFDGLNLYFQGWETEKDFKGVISLVHGLGEHSGRYTNWAGLLNQAGYTVLSYDLRGHGKSGGRRGHTSSFNDFLSDTDLLINEAKQRYPDAPKFLYGHSLGAIIVTNYVLRKKPYFNGVIVSGLANKTSLQAQKGKILLAKVLGSIIPSMSIPTGLIPATISRDPQVVEKYIQDPLVHSVATLGFAKGSMSAINYADQHAAEWNLPVLFMHGELDKLGYADGSREFAAKINGDCTLKIWPGMFHEIHNEPEKDQVFNYLREWLDAHI
jgi:alpha-beta hydrolase superfamily lysophospholipase